MRRLPELMIVGVSLLILAAFITTSTSKSHAMTEEESSMLYVVIQRIQNIEKQKGIKVPEQLKLKFNGIPEK